MASALFSARLAAAQPEPPPAAAPPSGDAPAEELPEAGTAPPAVGGAPWGEPDLPGRIADGRSGYLKPGTLIQGWLFLRRDGGATDETMTTFRIRRAELKISGALLDFIEFKVMIDPAKVLEHEEATVEVEGQAPPPTAPGTVTVDQPADKSSVLQDASVTFVTTYVEASIGQMKNPMSWEGYNTASKLLLPERALASREFGDDRDIGVKLEKEFEHFKYSLGLWNGEGLNQLDSNNQKDGTLRVELYPVEGVLVGGVAYTSLGQRSLPGTRDSFEGDLRVEVFDAVLQGEYLHSRERNDAGSFVAGHGFYGAVGYTFLDRVQPVARVGLLDTDVDTDGDEIRHYEGGLNYYFQKHDAKIQASYGYFDREDPRQEIVVSTQVKF